MSLIIPRGIVYHKVSDDILSLLSSLFSRLDNHSIIEAFENKFAQYVTCKECVAFPFARTAIYYALKAKGLPQGSEVVMPPITIKGILDAVLALELKPVFVDLDPDTLCFDIEQLKKSVNENTKAVLITYLFGMVPDIKHMISFCQEHDLFIIEDFSQCLNGKYNGKKVGGFGDVGVYSASSIKTLDTYGGGLLVTDNEALSQQIRQSQQELLPASRILLVQKIITDLIRNVATSRIIFHFAVFPLIKLINSIKPDSALKHTGDRNEDMIKSLPADWFKAFTSFQAKVGLKQIDLIAKSDSKRVSNVEYIKEHSSHIQFPRGVKGGENVYWQLIAYFNKPGETQQRFHNNKVDTSTTSLVQISNLPSYPYQGDTPNADRLYTNGLFIPAYPGLSQNDLANIVSVLNEEQSK